MYTGFKNDQDYYLHLMMNEFCEEGRMELEELGIQGKLMYYALMDDRKSFSSLWDKVLFNKVDSDNHG